jgi:D-alanine-D-alanine ligase
VKSAWEHASIGIDDGSVTNDPTSASSLLRKRRRRHGGEWFVEAYVEGREFNLSLLAGLQGVELLPPAEMCFVDYPPGKPRIVNYAAKWDAASFEFHATRRRFDFTPCDAALLGRLEATALACWRLFDLAGYARVDCRVEASGRVQVLEVNINPCLSPDAGFAAAAARAGLDQTAIMGRILGDLPASQRPATAGSALPQASPIAAALPG